MTTKNETTYITADFYKKKKVAVHITFTNGTWFNGIITSVNENHLILEEEKFGEMIIEFVNIKEGGIMLRGPKR